MSDQGKGLYKAYRGAGTGYLAYRLGRLFVKIETPEDIALHNDILSEVLKMIGGEEQQFLKAIAEDLLHKSNATDCQLCGSKLKPKTKTKRFFWGIANRIIQIGMKKGV